MNILVKGCTWHLGFSCPSQTTRRNSNLKISTPHLLSLMCRGIFDEVKLVKSGGYEHSCRDQTYVYGLTDALSIYRLVK